MKTSAHSETKCPKCSAPLNRSTSIFDDSTPKAGDLSVCGYCAALLTFDESLAMIELTEAARAELPAEAQRDLRAAQRLVINTRRPALGRML